MYRVSGRTAATAAVNNAICSLWNPHSTQEVRLIELGSFITAAGTAAQTIVVQRITARGTPGSTVTPNIENHSNRGIAPPSGLLLDLAAFSVQPTFTGEPLRISLANVASSGFQIPFEWEIPPGTGLAMKATLTAWPISDVNFAWREDW